MFDLSLVELLFIAVVALVVIGPKDLPKVIAAMLRLLRQFQDAFADLRSQVNDIVDESGVKETQQELKTIIDQHGRVQEVYDISDFLDEKGEYKISGHKDKEEAEDKQP